MLYLSYRPLHLFPVHLQHHHAQCRKQHPLPLSQAQAKAFRIKPVFGTAAKAGIGVGAVLRALIIGLGVFCVGRSARKKSKITSAGHDAVPYTYDGKPEIDGKQVNTETIPELDGTKTVYAAPCEHAELNGSTQASTTSPLPPIHSVVG
jgi:hypothetical protein